MRGIVFGLLVSDPPPSWRIGLGGFEEDRALHPWLQMASFTYKDCNEATQSRETTRRSPGESQGVNAATCPAQFRSTLSMWFLLLHGSSLSLLALQVSWKCLVWRRVWCLSKCQEQRFLPYKNSIWGAALEICADWAEAMPTAVPPCPQQSHPSPSHSGPAHCIRSPSHSGPVVIPVQATLSAAWDWPNSPLALSSLPQPDMNDCVCPVTVNAFTVTYTTAMPNFPECEESTEPWTCPIPCW